MPRGGGEAGAAAAALELSGVVKRFGPKTVLGGVSLRVMFGERVAVAGPNGAGKTTLLKISAGLLEADDGVVSRGGWVVYVPELDYVPRFTRVSDWFAMHGCGSVEDAAAAVGADAARVVEGFWGRRAVELSKGQRRLVGILSALCLARAGGVVVLLDEPYAGLAEEYRSLVASAVRASKATIVAAVHSLGEASTLGGRVYWLEEGRLTQVRVEGLKARVYIEAADARGSESRVAGPEEVLSLLRGLLYSGLRGVRRVCVEPLS